MKRTQTIVLVLIVVALVQMACSMPRPQSTNPTPVIVTSTTGPIVVTATAGAPTQPAPATQVPATQVPATATTAPTVVSGNNTNNNSTGSCTFQATFVKDVTVPDDTYVTPGSAFTKTWRIRNDGTCTWGPNLALHALAFTGGSKLSGPDQVSLPGNVAPGYTIDVSVNLVAPAAAGVYTSEWKFRVDGVSGAGPYIGVGPSKTGSLYARIIVGSTPTPTFTPTTTPATTRIEFGTGKTGAAVDGTVKASGTRSYILSAGKNQLLMAGISSMSSDLRIQIVEVSSGKSLINAPAGSVQVYLPSTGDFLIQILGGSSDASFVLGVNIPYRITFDPGAISASVDGKITAKEPVMYIIRAQAGQTMTVKLTSPSNGVALTIYGIEDGSPLVRADFGLSEWTGNLNLTQDYMIMVMPSVDNTTFTMTVTIP
jgi:hypothetical protein